jgi:hypothetical protein
VARNFRELEAKMNPADRADNERLLREELERIARDAPDGAEPLTPAEPGSATES